MTIMRSILTFVTGVIITTATFIFIGRVEISGDFAANVAGATIGGMISVGLALYMFERERRGARLEAARLVTEQRDESVRQALRYIRAIKECIQGGYAFNINNSQRIIPICIEADSGWGFPRG